ncbi:GNAT family N-acetyltransferase [Cellulomonas marina]|uniref:N-acetyltransferase domain-containing protein n=1 Tax=Cellulomonas marina TaxID=988821 RepID=A0A1I0VMF8_9CELL|nr:GNAT family N-acetyltransferase [Cellulomonas marina]GIG27872.1 acetyltransferase [Cellulomonas marina]SFA77679.1 hypothetical protein SAMN05421867_101493 [Cellulomonas marina]
MPEPLPLPAHPPLLDLRPVVEADLPALARLNDGAVPAVNGIGTDGLARLVAMSALALTAGPADDPAALLLALAPGADYASENYRWFSRHRPGSLYVDRVVVADAVRGSGLGSALHAVVLAEAVRRGLGEVTCEVNLEPPNPGSLRFHTRLGFVPVGEQDTDGGAKRVVMLARGVQG